MMQIVQKWLAGVAAVVVMVTLFSGVARAEKRSGYSYGVKKAVIPMPRRASWNSSRKGALESPMSSSP